MKVNILILNYFGEDLLKRFLPSIVKAAAASKHDCKVTVVDNVSTDGSEAVVRSFGDRVEWMPMRENRVLCSYNDAASRLSDDILIFMNNDIEVEPDFVDGLIEPFTTSNDIFFVTPRVLSKATRAYEGNRTRGEMKYGLFRATALFPGHETGIDRLGPTLHGGFGAFDRMKFLALGGYDDLYLPGRLEDADICFRAYQRGWRCLYQPSSIVYHEGGVSFNRKFGSKRTLIINARNTYLFMWKNLTDPGYWAEFWLFLLPRLIFSALTLRTEWVLGFFQALPRLGSVWSRRRAINAQPHPARLSDRAILGMV